MLIFKKKQFDQENYVEEIEHIKKIYEMDIHLHGRMYGRGTWHGRAIAQSEVLALFKAYELSIHGVELQSEEEFQKEKKSLWMNCGRN